ncbi:hypothetical protein W02_37200 [Nitrospira sp. KM1]|uniref:FecR family protein n=1 Tax=Nitrospira sp. KM1 TaxID=1936990 RepID=UPI0013A744E4|nr:FecR family protein [Nitrospira sp. KM1]BCA56580.1 hypothetical protein W02_37200 [Nitrospira sp. KM1]
MAVITNETEQDRWREASSEASYWIALSAEEMSADDTARFTEWLATDPLHERAYQDVARFWGALDRIPPEDARQLDQYVEVPVRNPSETVPVESSSTTRLLRKHGRTISGRRLALVAASIVLVLGVWWVAGAFHMTADYRTATGELRSITLDDGTRVDLGPRTALSVAFDAGFRKVTLHEGEAFFQVAPDAARPFEVEAGWGSINALGTAFNVHRYADHVMVMVSEHAVRVATTADPSNGLRLEAGNRVRYDDTGRIGTAEAADTRRELAWKRQRLVFENQPLEDVIEDLNRYRSGWIIVRDSTLKRLSITASVDTGHPDRALRMIEETLPVSSLRITDRVVLLSRGTTFH